MNFMRIMGKLAEKPISRNYAEKNFAENLPKNFFAKNDKKKIKFWLL